MTGAETMPASVGRYLSEIGAFARVSRAQEVELAARIQRGDRAALHALVTANLRLVVMFARQYAGLGLPLPDLISEGNLGLVRAAELFDPERGFKFGSYAALWIKQAIFRALNEAAAVRVPLQKAVLLRKTRRAAGELEARLGRRATDAEVATVAGVKPGDLARLRAASVSVTSLDAPLAGMEEGDNTTLADVIPDERAADTAREVSHRDSANSAMALLATLDRRERQILALSFGLHGQLKTCRDIARQFNVSHQRVIQLRNAALLKLRRRMRRL